MRVSRVETFTFVDNISLITRFYTCLPKKILKLTMPFKLNAFVTVSNIFLVGFNLKGVVGPVVYIFEDVPGNISL